MCGIYGLLNPEGTSSESVVAARDRLAHRGPDDAGLWMSPDGKVALAHCRLSIVELSSLGHQPMQSECGRYVVVFNGEIYNYVELRDELRRAGERFRGGSDTEVILAAYRRWGADSVARFNGMFAFAIYDRGTPTESRRLFIARDRAGKKPFYYSQAGGRFEFASELKAMVSGNGLSLRALNFYLALGYVPDEFCIRSGVLKLPPAHAGYFDFDSGKLTTWRYWRLPKNTAAGDSDGESLAERAGDLLQDAVRLRLRSDVPVGVFLSGGLDSSLVAAAAQRVSGAGVKTFTVAFPGTSHDESGYADLVARYLGSDHHTLKIPAPSFDTLDELAGKLDEPLADSSLIPSYLISKFTRAHVKVALGGDGGDELFGGYSDYQTALADAARLGWVPDGLLRRLGRLAGLLPAGIRGRNRLYALQGGPFQSLIWGTPYFDIDLRRRILSRDARAVLNDSLDEPERWLLSLFHEGGDPVDAMTRTHFGSILADDFLVKVDRASMAVGLELRSPFLDTRLVEFAFGCIPWKWKVQGRESRRIERILAHRWLPSNLDLNRKQGFSIPLNEWLRTTGCQPVEAVRSHLPPAINQEEVNRLIAGHRAGRANGGRLYALQMLAMTNRPQGYAT
jgi:asparagine synthase (glutamine-hydrolysing)